MAARTVDSPYAWFRLGLFILLSTVSGVGMWSVVVALPAVQAEFGVAHDGADAVSSSNTFTALPLIDPDTLEFELNVDGFASYGGLGGPAILPLSLAKVAELMHAFADKEFSGIGGIATFAHALNYFLLGCGTVQLCTAAMLDHEVGPNVIKALLRGLTAFLERHVDKSWSGLADFCGLRRGRVVAHAQIRRPDETAYHGGHDTAG
jgi:hypothetical protein